MIEAHFIVVEGIDGAGTTTHSRFLVDYFRNRGLPARLTREPSDGPVGVLVRNAMTGRIVVPGLRGARPPSWGTMALLFAADRLDHIETEIQPNLMDGVTVISDRYVHSSIAYQTLTGGGDDATRAWVAEINRHAITPNLTILLDVPAEVAAKRRRARLNTHDIYEDDELQVQLAAFYRKLDAYFPDQRIVHVNADRPREEVHQEIIAHVRALRNER